MSETKRFITDIRIGSRRRTQPGNLDDLAASIADEGLRHPVVITPGNRLISGYRRLKAVELLNLDDIPVHVADDLAAAAALIAAENDDRACQAPMSAAELVDYVAALRDLPRSPRMRTLREATDAILDFGYSKYCLVQQVVDAAREEGDPDGPLHRGLDRLDVILAGGRAYGEDGRPVSLKTLAAAAGEVLARPVPSAPPERVTPAGRRTPPRAQAKALGSAIAGLNGLIAGLNQVESIDPTLSPADAARWIGDINRAQRTLRTLANRLKEHADAAR